MGLFFRLSRAFAVLAGIFVLAPAAQAQNPAAPSVTPRAQITQAIDESRLAPLQRALHPAANAANDRGRVADDFAMPHLLLQLQRAPAQEQALDQLIDQLHDPNSPNFHHWLTADEFGSRFGLAVQDRQTITNWLQQHGFTVNFTYPNGTLIDFSGTAAQVREAFHTEIHHLSVNGEAHIANMSAPQIPAALAGAVIGIVGLNDFKPQRQYRPRVSFTFPNDQGGTTYALTPADLAVIYNINPLFNAGISGQGQTIAVIEDTDVYSTADWSTFRATFGLSGYPGSFTQIHPAPTKVGELNCSDPGLNPNGDEGEAILDAEWASAAAPSAAIVLASCSEPGSTADPLLVAVENLVNGPSPPPIISISYGVCEQNSTDRIVFSEAYQQAVAQGISVFVASGDWGAAVCDASFNNDVVATHNIGVNALASSPYDVAVGGTDFADEVAPTFHFGRGGPSAYWNAANGPTFGSAQTYVPEIPWNDSCANNLLAILVAGMVTAGSNGFCNSAIAQENNDQFLNIVAGSGGPSQFGPKPSWQSAVVGVPSDGVRDLPDVSLFAGNGIWGHYYVFCWSDPAYIPNNGGAAVCGGNPSAWSGAGGTSFASPIMAGIQALVNQHNGGPQGNPNPVYYALAAAEYGAGSSTACSSTASGGPATSCVFYDVTEGTNDVPCQGVRDCYTPSGFFGVLSTSESSEADAYLALGGWDFATGIGTVNAANLVNQWTSGQANLLSVSVSGSGSITSSPAGINCGATCNARFAQGQQVTLTATPGTGWALSGWGGACNGTGSCVVTLNATINVTATFIQVSIPVTVSVIGDGIVTSSPPGLNCGGGFSVCTANFARNQQIIVIAAPPSGWVVMGFEGLCGGGGTECPITVETPGNETVIFGSVLTVQKTGNGSVTSSVPQDSSNSGLDCGSFCAETFPGGQQVTLTPNPAAGWVFGGWGNACVGIGNCRVTINGAATVTALFDQIGGGGGANNLWAYSCTDTSFDNLNAALAGMSAWSSTTSAAAATNGNVGRPISGDLVEIANICLGDVTIATDGLILTNHNDSAMSPLTSSLFPDGIEGQVEVEDARGVIIRNLGLSGIGAATSDVANLYVHDGAAATIEHDLIGSGWDGNGMALFGQAAVSVLDTKIDPQQGQYGILAADNSSLTMGNTDGSEPSTIGNSVSVAGIALQGHSSAEIYGSTVVTNAPSQIIVRESSSAALKGADVTQAANTAGPALQAIDGSSLFFDALGNGTGSTVNGSNTTAMLLAGMSSANVHNATFTSTSHSQPTIDASANSSIILAGGNTISNSATGGTAIQIDHTSSLIHEPATQLGFAANAPETITGNGSILMQSSIDLGQGPIAGAYGLTWNGSIAIGQNSAIRLQGGAHVTGSVQISGASNGYLNCNNAGGNCSGAGAANQVDGSIQCLQMVGSPTNPGAHLSNPPLATPSNPAADLLGTGFAATAEPANTCLNF